MLILIVEDDPVASTVAAHELERLGHRVAHATDGEAGWAQFEASRPDLVVPDLQMPGLSGAELVERMLTQSPHTPIVLISALLDHAERVIAAHRSAALRFVRKPARLRDLATAIADVSAHTLRG